MKNWYILYVKSGLELTLVETLKSQLNPDVILPFVLTKDRYFKQKGIMQLLKEICFPGYVFFESSLDGEAFLRTILPKLKGIKYIGHFLDYGSNDMAMKKEEQAFFLSLCGANFHIGSSAGIIENNVIKILSGPLFQKENLIKKIDRHKRTALIETTLINAQFKLHLPLVIEKKVTCSA